MAPLLQASTSQTPELDTVLEENGFTIEDLDSLLLRHSSPRAARHLKLYYEEILSGCDKKAAAAMAEAILKGLQQR